MLFFGSIFVDFQCFPLAFSGSLLLVVSVLRVLLRSFLAYSDGLYLRTVPPFFLLRIRFAHLESGSRYSNFLRNLPTNTKVFLRDL